MRELWTIADVAAHWGVSESRARAILAGAGERSGYDPQAVMAIVRPGQGARSDLVAAEIADLAARIIADYPGERVRRVERYTLDDGIAVTVGWHQEVYEPAPYDAHASLVHVTDYAAFGVGDGAVAAHRTYPIRHDDATALARQLTGPLAATRADRDAAQRREAEIDALRAHHLGRVREAAQRYAEIEARPAGQRGEIIDASSALRYALGAARDCSYQGLGDILSAAEIAEAAGVAVGEVERAPRIPPLAYGD